MSTAAAALRFRVTRPTIATVRFRHGPTPAYDTIPLELEVLEQLEDLQDLRDAEAAFTDPTNRKPISWAKAKRKLKL